MKTLLVLLVITAIVVANAGFGFLVMFLWNTFRPEQPITFVVGLAIWLVGTAIIRLLRGSK
jgi:hypothetical protein